MRVLCLSGYSHPSHHRKIELLANKPELEILHILQPGNGKNPGWCPSADGRQQYRVEVVPSLSLGRSGDPHRTIHWPPRFFIKEFKPDIIHCEHEQESLMALEVALARRLFAPKTPLLLYSWQNIVRRRSLPVRLACSVTLHAAQHVVCASREAAEVLLQQGFQGSTSIAPLVGLDARYFFPKPVAILREKLKINRFAVGFMGRLVPEKGVDVLLKAVSQIDKEIYVLIVGDGPDETRLQSIAADLQLSDYCRFAGGVPFDEIVNYLNLLDILVLSSQSTPNWKEQYGRILVEAMACKVAVVGSDSGAIPDVINDSNRIFPEGDPHALALILNELICNSEALAKAGEYGYQRVMSTFTVEEIADQTFDVWRELLND